MSRQVSRGSAGEYQADEQAGVVRLSWRQSLGLEDLLEEGMATHSSILPGESPGQRSWEGCSPWGHRESNMNDATAHTHI